MEKIKEKLIFKFKYIKNFNNILIKNKIFNCKILYIFYFFSKKIKYNK